MLPNEQPRFAALIADALGFWKQDISEFGLSVWWQGCKGYTLQEVSKALSQHATDPDRGQFAPKVADIVRILGGTKSDRSLLEWGRVHAAMSEVGAYTDVDFGDPSTHAAIRDMGGWPKLCRTNIDELSYLQHRFCELYKAYDGREGVATALMGDRSPDDVYAKRGLPPPKPVVIPGANPANRQTNQLQGIAVKALNWIDNA